MIEKEEILALDVEDQCLGVHRRRSQHSAREERVEQERGVCRLGGDTGDAGDVDVRAAAAVEELEVDVERLARPRDPDRQPFGHPVEEQSLVAFVTGGAPDLLTGTRRHERLWLESGGGHLGRLRDLRREDPV